MHTEHLCHSLSPQVHAALLGGLQRRAERERRAAVRTFFSLSSLGRWARQAWRPPVRLAMPGGV